MHTLITLLGKGRSDIAGGYRNATYRFDDGGEFTTPYFGLALARHLKPSRIVILGTASSMWDVFIEHLAQEGDDEALRLELMERVAAGTVDEALLARAAPMIARAVDAPVEPHLIGMARDEGEQRAVLETLASHVDAGEVSLDLTHGFRHLGMLGFLSAFMLERLSPRIQLAGLWYAALDMTPPGGTTPVLRLDGLSAIQRWIDAMSRFDASGDYGAFAPLLERDGLPGDKAAALREAAFRERTSNILGARDKLRTALTALAAPLPGASGLFQPRLLKLLAWAREDNFAECQRLLAMRALDRGDYPRAAMLGIEALISRRAEEEGHDPLAFDVRDAHRRALAEASETDWQRAAYFALNALRNGMAHGIPPTGKIKAADGRWRPVAQVLQNQAELERVLRASLDRLINRKPAARQTPAQLITPSAFAALGALRDGAPDG